MFGGALRFLSACIGTSATRLNFTNQAPATLSNARPISGSNSLKLFLINPSLMKGKGRIGRSGAQLF
jgi:hypothetical protein